MFLLKSSKHLLWTGGSATHASHPCLASSHRERTQRVAEFAQPLVERGMMKQRRSDLRANIEYSDYTHYAGKGKMRFLQKSRHRTDAEFHVKWS